MTAPIKVRARPDTTELEAWPYNPQWEGAPTWALRRMYDYNFVEGNWLVQHVSRGLTQEDFAARFVPVDEPPVSSDPYALLITVASAAADQFAFYGREHRAKGTPAAEEKAEVNEGWAENLRLALAEIERLRK